MQLSEQLNTVCCLLSAACCLVPHLESSNFEAINGIMSTQVVYVSVNDICAFVTSFVVNGGSTELRAHARNIASILTSQFQSDSMDSFLRRMGTICIREVGSLGHQSIDFCRCSSILFRM
jgi:hypothetical protein